MDGKLRRQFLANAIIRFWPFWLFHVRRFAWPILAFLFVTSIIGFRYGRGIRIDTNLLHLLPADTESLVRLKELRDASEVKGFVVVTLEAATPQSEDKFVKAAHQVESIIRGDEFLNTATSKVIYEIPGDFLQRYSLYYADYADLVKIRDRLKNTIVQTKRRENPYFEDLEQTAPPQFYIGDILNKYRKRYLNSNAFIDKERLSITILLSLKQPPDDIGFSKSIVSNLNDRVGPYAKEQGFNMRLTGRYASDVEKQKHLTSDINQSTTITLLILISSLIVFFRSMRVLIVIGLPVMAALGYTYHAAWYFIGQISIISSFLTSILLGLGIDYGIHLFARYKSERLAGSGMTRALETTMRNLFRGLSFGMISTAAVFLTLSFSHFIAFSEFGKIALAGIIFFFLSFILFFPALIFITERFSFATTEPSHMLEKTRKIRGWHVALIAAVISYGIITLAKPPFEYDFFQLDTANVSSDAATNAANATGFKVLENREHMVIYEFATHAALVAAVADLRSHAASYPAEFHSAIDLIPRDAAAKQIVLQEIHNYLRQAELFSLVTFDNENLRKIRMGLRLTEASAVVMANIPEEFRQHLYRNGKYYLYIFPKDVKQYKRGALDFAAAYRSACSVTLQKNGECPETKTVRGISDLYVLDDILRTVMHDLVKEILLISLVIAAIVLTLTRRAAGMLLILGPLVAGILGLFAVVGIGYYFYPAWFFKFNYINLLAIPILLGVGIDNGIYLYSHTRELGLSQVNHIMVGTGGSIFISNFTTAMGFLSLTISSHIGLASFGFITFVGMLCVFYAYRLLFPTLARLFEKLEAEI